MKHSYFSILIIYFHGHLIFGSSQLIYEKISETTQSIKLLFICGRDGYK